MVGLGKCVTVDIIFDIHSLEHILSVIIAKQESFPLHLPFKV